MILRPNTRTSRNSLFFVITFSYHPLGPGNISKGCPVATRSQCIPVTGQEGPRGCVYFGFFNI